MIKETLLRNKPAIKHYSLSYLYLVLAVRLQRYKKRPSDTEQQPRDILSVWQGISGSLKCLLEGLLKLVKSQFEHYRLTAKP